MPSSSVPGGGVVAKSCPALATPWTGVGCRFLLQGIFSTHRFFTVEPPVHLECSINTEKELQHDCLRL